MKNFSKMKLAAVMIASFFSLTACEHEDVKPQKLNSQDKAEVKLTGRDDLVFERHYITKRGGSTMEYDADHRLTKVNLTPNYNVQYNWYTQNSTKYLSAKTYMGGKLVKTAVYSLNSSNKAIKVVSQYFSPVGALIKTETHGFEYFTNTGKLRKIYNTDPNINEQTIFMYDGAGDIRQISYVNMTTNQKVFTDFWYTNSDYPSRKMDRYRFNAELENLDFYPRIFGSFSKNLPVRTLKRTVVNGNLTQTARNYKYAFNVDGYVSNRKITNGLDNSLISSEDFDYLVVLVGM